MNHWTVIAPLTFVVVEADTSAEARQIVLDGLGYGHKPWLARDWEVRKSTRDDLVRYATQVDAQRRSQPTHVTAKKKTKTMKEKLL